MFQSTQQTRLMYRKSPEPKLPGDGTSAAKKAETHFAVFMAVRFTTIRNRQLVALNAAQMSRDSDREAQFLLYGSR